MKAAPVILLASIVLLTSGCIEIPGLTSVPTGTGNGVQIVEFQSDLDNVYSGESVNFQLKIQNRGSFDAKGDSYIYLGEWTCTPGRTQSVSFQDLLAPNPDKGTQGEEFIATWKCTAPEVDKGLEVPYEARVEVQYDYKTITSKSVTLLPTPDMIALRDSGQTLPSELISSSNSPVNVQIQIDGPIRVMRESKSVTFPVNIIIDNAGGGVIEGNTVKLELEGLGGINIASADCNGEQTLSMWRGKSQTVTCEMSATNVNFVSQARIVATLTYGYTVNALKNVNVQGTRAAYGI